MFRTFKTVFSGSPFSLKQIEDHYNKRTEKLASKKLVDYAFNYAKENDTISLENLIILMIKKELLDVFYEKARYIPSRDLIEKAISYYEEKKDNNYKKLNCFISIDDLVLYMIKIDKNNFYKENFILAFKNKHKRNPTLSELKKIDSKIKETDANYNPTTNQSFILSLLSLFTLSEILSETKKEEENSYLSDTFYIPEKPSYTSETKSDISSETHSSGSGSGTGSGSGCSGTGSGSGSGCSGSGSGCSGGS